MTRHTMHTQVSNIKRKEKVPQDFRGRVNVCQEFVRSSLACGVHLAAWPATNRYKSHRPGSVIVLQHVCPAVSGSSAQVFRERGWRCGTPAALGTTRQESSGVVARFGKRSCRLVTIESTTCARSGRWTSDIFERKRRHSASRKGSNQPLLTAPASIRHATRTIAFPFNRGSSIAIFTLHMR